MPADVEHPDEFGRPLLRSGVSDRIWTLLKTDKPAFQQEVRRYFELCYPGWTVVRAKYPDIFLRDDREGRMI
ncbi:hypothetical protein J19TS2_31220 [Cohnella xylanilytica]|uniref:hypothetical protein n=1 Tax=Cohnella xylanilytica TaxID=557555 RepID=UPI001B100684|nr:hypothetical protein [Cohnella xylanilytica]GIO13567.1 hypothetical protein J19TS2_31220 [Cohnella xylanilytica]